MTQTNQPPTNPARFKAALLAEVDRGGSTVAEVARRRGIAESLLHNWRSHRRAQASVASEPLQFISDGR